jgi:hypothetical protein
MFGKKACYHGSTLLASGCHVINTTTALYATVSVALSTDDGIGFLNTEV